MKVGLSVCRSILQFAVLFGVCCSLYSKCPRLSSQIRVRQCLFTPKNAIHQTGVSLHLSAEDDKNPVEDDVDPEDPYSEGFENQKEWLKLFPRKRDTPEMLREYPDFSSLEPNDPLFLDMPWPTKAGPEASAFGKHMQWRRGLSDGERLRWQKWAVYQRIMERYHFKYSLEDYIMQNMLRDIKNKADKAGKLGFHIEESMWQATARTYSDQQSSEVSAVMKSLYSAFNRKNYDELRALWLPDESVEMTFPGFEKAKGANEVQKMYRQVIKESRPFGAVDARVVAIACNGYVAVVQSIETVIPGTELKFAKKKNAPVVKTKPPAPKRVFATTVLRKFNKQWRVMIHHAGRFSSSPYTGDQKKITDLALGVSGTSKAKKQTALRVEEKSDREMVQKGENRVGPSMSASELQSLIKGGSLLSVSRMNREGGWEKVVAVDNDLSREGGGGKAGFKYDEDGVNRSTQNLIDLKAEGIKSKENLIESKAALIKSKAALIDNQEIGRKIRFDMDGNLYLGEEQVTTKKEKSVTQELEEGTARLNNFIPNLRDDSESNNSNIGTGGGARTGWGTGVKSGNSVSGIKISKEGGVGSAIDENASVSKQTIQALRYLFKAGRISREMKETLMLDIIDHVVNHETSLVVVAFELLAVKAKDSREKLRPWSEALSSGGVGLEEFADQCSVLIENIESSVDGLSGAGFSFSGSNSKEVRSRNGSRSNNNNRKSLVYTDDDSDDE